MHLRIPTQISVFSCEENIFVFVGPLGHHSLKLSSSVKLSIHTKSINVTKTQRRARIDYSICNNENSKLTTPTIISALKKSVNTLTTPYRKKLTLIGVGFRFSLRHGENVILEMKLGYSHQLYIKLPVDIHATCLNSFTLILSGNCSVKINSLAAYIRSYKIPDAYKGKGVVYENEIVSLKASKGAVNSTVK